jgi:hypothetical protein
VGARYEALFLIVELKTEESLFFISNQFQHKKTAREASGFFYFLEGN